MLVIKLFYICCVVAIVPTTAINKVCNQQSSILKCPQNSFCNSQRYCQCQSNWVLNCSIFSPKLSQQSKTYQISQQPSYYTVIPSSNDVIYVYRFYLCVEGQLDKFQLNLSLFADDGIQNQFSSQNLIGQIKIESGKQCWPLFSPYILFQKQPNGKIQQLVLSVNTFSSQQLSTKSIKQNQVNYFQQPRKVSNAENDSKKISIKLSVMQIFFIKLSTLKLIVVLLMSIIIFLILARIIYYFLIIKRNQTLRNLNNLSNNIDHFEQMIPKHKYKQVNNQKYDHTCPICLLDFQLNQLIRTTFCNHIFHYQCLDSWCLKILTCPVCRTSLQQKFMIEQNNQGQSKTGQNNGSVSGSISGSINGCLNGSMNLTVEEDDNIHIQLSSQIKQNVREALIK